MTRRNALVVLVIALTAGLVWLAFVWQPEARVAAPTPEQKSAAAAGGDFVLLGADGPVALSAYRGRAVLIYFGYTFCPDVCPTSLALIAQALSALTPDERAQVAALFISLDPERDTPEVLKVYAPFFHPDIVGLTGSPAQIAGVAGQYGARYMKQKPDSDGLYSVDHSSFTTIVGRDGKLAANLPYGSSVQHIVDMIRSVLGSANKE